MLSKTLARAQTATGFSTTGDGGAGNPQPLRISDADYFQGNLQVSIVGTSATVLIFGRASPAMPWFQLASISASGVTQVSILSEMYAQVSAISAATVDVALNYPCN